MTGMLQSDSSAVSRMETLIARLNEASAAYYNGLEELMSNYEWDALYDELSSLETESGIILPDSPTQRVGEDTTAGQKETHEFPALSLAKTKQTEELTAWADHRPVWVSWKLDGLTLVATYDNGSLTRLLTRGNGTSGTNITHLAPSVEHLPLTIPHTGHLVVRGEAVISYSDFDRFLLESGEDYANPRNLASGSLSLKDSAEVRRRHIQFIPFSLVYAQPEIPSWGDRMSYLAEIGFSPVDREAVPDPKHLPEVIGRWTRRVESGAFDFPVDGLVVTYDDTVYAASGSITGHHATRAGLAYKWADTAADSKLLSIEWSCAASTITPVAVFEPVSLEGTTVSRATLCNISECERLGVGGPGTRLRVIKANKIIPKVIEVTEPVGSFVIPEVCPVCGAEAILQNSASGARTLHCSNPDCIAKNIRKFSRFVSRSAMDIDGLSTQTITRLINLGWVRTYADLYHLDDHAEEMKMLEGFGEKSVSNLMASIARSRSAASDRFLYALNIPLCGQDVAKRLLSRYPLGELLDLAEHAEDPAVFSDIDGIGPEKSASFVRWFSEEKNHSAVRLLMKELTLTDPERIAAGGRCEGLTFVVTGDVFRFKNRSELKSYIESQGGKVTGSVTKKTSFLINNDITSTSGKNRKAQELSVPLLSEDAFISRFGAPF